MNPREEAKAHLGKAREFLEAADLSIEVGLFNAAAASAVVSGINSKDAICLKLTGRSDKTKDHGQAVTELRGAGTGTADVSTALGRLLRLKNKSQYQTGPTTRSEAMKSITWARKLHDRARIVVSS